MSDSNGFFRRHNTVSAPIRDNVHIGAVLNPQVQHLYSFALFDTETFEVVTAPELDIAQRTQYAEYFFRVPPKSYEMSEPMTTHIVHTQNDGKFVESHGSLTKDIRITGTTGLRPNKAAPNTIPLFQAAKDLVNPEALISRSTIPLDREITGYDDIIFLRNIFRYYSDRKHSDELAARTILMFRNAKEDDYWVVEPMDFRLTANSSSPLTYEYQIQLKTIARFDYNLKLPADPLEALRARERARARLAKNIRQLGNAFFLLNAQLTRLRGTFSFAANNVLVPLASLVNGLIEVKNQPKRFGQQVASNINTLRTQLRSLVSVLHETHDLRNSPLALATHRTAVRTLVEISQVENNPLFPSTEGSTTEDTASRYASAYNRSTDPIAPFRNPDVGNSSTFIGNQPRPNKVRSGVVNGGETIKDVAQRLTGDRGQWQMLVALNNLRFPYIAASPGPGVLAPGDHILYNSNDDGVSPEATTAPTDATQDPILSAYGTDIRLVTAVTPGGVEYTTVAVGPSGDFDTVSGLDNVKQAIQIKFVTEPGTLTVHPKFGAAARTGMKMTQESFNEIRINTQATILTDDRIKAIKNIEFFAEGDILGVSVVAELVGVQSVVPTNFVVRS